jgi:hypothetical protein
MHDRVDPCERPTDDVPVADVADDELDAVVEVVGTRALMNLRIEVVERAHVGALGEQAIGEMRPDEARAACDQHLHGRA